MKKIKREETIEKIIYEITKEELEDIKREARNKGIYDVIEYLRFAISNYKYELNLKGIELLVNELCDFLMDETDTIRNICGYSFRDYIYKYRKNV